MQTTLSKGFLLAILILFSCGNQTGRDTEGLIIYQENQISWVRNFEPLNPVSVCRWPTRGAIYETLFLYNPIKIDWTPWLATDYNWQDNNKKLLLTIRSGVQWSDGQPFSAHDVAYTFNLTKEFPALDTRNYWDYLESVIAVSDTEIEVNFKRIYVPGFDAIAGTHIVPKHIWVKLEDPLTFDNPNPVGTGPFTEILRFNSQIWELGKNPNYWQAGKPYIEKLIFPTFSTNEQTTLALLSGNLDYAGAFIPAIDRIYVDKDPEHHHYWFRNTGHSTFLHTNTKDPVLSNVSVRKAISYAINRDQVVKVGMYNYTTPAHVTSLAGSMAIWHSPEIMDKENWVAFNPNKANMLLDSAGFEWKNEEERVNPDGSPLEFNIIVVSGWSDWVRSAQVITQNLKEVGIKTNVRTYDFGAWIARMQKGDFEMAIGWADKGSTPYNFFKSMMFSGYVKPIGEVADLNWHRFGLEEADILFKEFEQTSDEERIKNIISKLQHLFIENAPGIPLFAELSWAEYNSKYFTGFPNEQNPYGPLSPNEPGFIFTLLNVKKR
tara:strand:+ start:3483 stop:5126 length:1644 start_codon:yes stop_codon:yes gene_type:complete